MTFPEIILVYRRTAEQRGFFPNQKPPEHPLPRWWAEAFSDGVYIHGEGETEEEARYRAIHACLK